MLEIRSKDVEKVIVEFQEKIYKSSKNIISVHKELIDMLTLDKDYDNPDAVMQASDAQSSLYAYYSMLFHFANKRLSKVETSYKLWKGRKEIDVKNKLFKINTDNGMTANNARPTEKDISNYFHKKFNKNSEYIRWQKRIDKLSEQVSQLRIMRDTIGSRGEMLKQINFMLGQCINSGVIVPSKDKSKKFKKRSRINNN